MKSFYKIVVFILLFLCSGKNFAQHNSKITAEVNLENKTITIQQEITFYNQSNDTLSSIVLNDWNNAYSNNFTPLSERFSDEFYRGFHLAKEIERGSTINLIVLDNNGSFLPYERTKINPDFIEIAVTEKIKPFQKKTIKLTYISKIPSAKFTKYGYTDKGGMNLKNWFLTPARYENKSFARYNNFNLDDGANGACNFEINLKIPENIEFTTDLNTNENKISGKYSVYKLTGENRSDFSLFIEPKTTFFSYKNSLVEVLTDMKSNKLDINQKGIIIDKIVQFVNSEIGEYPNKKIIVSQDEYEKNPFYGLNQLPAFLSPFSDEFMFEIKFIKTYLNAYLKNSLHLDPRKDNWIYDGVQIYTMMKYIEANYPESKMMGSVYKNWLLKGFNLTNIGFNEQYSYFYMLMARKNLDQPLGNSKNTLIKFNEQIANKYRAGISINYLDKYLENNIVTSSLHDFHKLNQERQTSSSDLESILKSKTDKDINWFFNTIINTRDIIDYKFTHVSKTKDSVTFTIKNKNGLSVPIPVYGINKDTIVFKKWIENTTIDSSYTLARNDAEKIILNYNNEVPEINLRNNWKKLEGFFPNNRPLKFTPIKDLENPYYNQVLYAPILTYNVYDGLSPGMRFHNKAILNKPFIFDFNPTYSIKSKNLSGSIFLAVSKDYRNSTLYNMRYSVGSSYFHYAPDATYLKINPMVLFQIREENYRDNRKQMIMLRQVIINREESLIVIDNSLKDYSVFDAKYVNTKTELTNHISYVGDLQISSEFGKITSEIGYRKLFDDNRQINLRFYAGRFLYNKSNSDFFSFALDRPTDYLFDYNYYARSEDTGFFSHQFVMAEGGFKSKLDTSFANQWMATLNGSFNVWNWVEIYGDLGFIKNKYQNKKFVYDSGVRLNLLTDYFELFFPVYSNNGWEIAQSHYNEKIRFVITLDPSKLINLFTRKWF